MYSEATERKRKTAGRDNSSRIREHFLRLGILLAAVFLSPAARAGPADEGEWPYFYPDDPIAADIDTLPVPEPVEFELSQYYDFIENTFIKPGSREETGARNTNTLGEVPASSWFTPRLGSRVMTVDEVVRGPKTGSGPDTDHPWTVISAKTEGITPGFVIRDARDDVYFVKFDPTGHREMATSAEAICTPLFHAMGYHVPENYLLDVPVGLIVVGDETTVKDKFGKKRQMTDDDLSFILEKTPVDRDGTLRVIASKAIAGHPLGHFQYYGTRPDDANDIIPHQYRRELRGLSLFAAWLNHDDARSINSLDIYTAGNYVRHYLIDFGSCLGSGSVKPQTYRAGNEYLWEAAPTFKTMGTLGIWLRPYLKISYPDYPSIGRFESKAFEPERWKPEYPNPAFEMMDEEDAFWAAAILMSFTDSMVRSVVEEGRLSNDEAREYMIRTLLERRDKIGAHYLNRVNPTGRFELEGNGVRFTNLSVEYGFGAPPEGYSVNWREYDNEARLPGALLGTPQVIPADGPGTGAGARMEIPEPRTVSSPTTYIFAEVTPTGGAPGSWRRPVRLFLREAPPGWKIVGITR